MRCGALVSPSLFEKSCCKWDLSKDLKDSINAKSPNVMSISKYKSRSVLVDASESLKSSFRRKVFQG